VKQNNRLKVLATLVALIFWCVNFIPSLTLPALAVVPTTNSTSTATGDGVTNTFTFTFELLQASDMTVYVNSALQTYNVAYIVTPTGGSYPCTGGTITFQATYTPANNAAILMARQLTLTQTINLPVEGSLPSSTIQTVFDRACMQIQQLNTATSLCLQLPITSIGVNTALPTPVALNVIGWDSLAQNVVNYTPQAIVANVGSIGLGNMVGPATSVVNDVAAFNNTTGTLTKDTGILYTNLITTSNLPQQAVFTNVRAYLVSGSPFADGSSSGNTTLYMGPITQGKFQTYDNGSGVLTTAALTEVSYSLSSLASGDSYDFYLYNNSGTWTIEADQWSGVSTPLSTSTDAAGRLTKSGSTNKLLIASGTCLTAGKLYMWTGERDFVNQYNKFQVPLFCQDTTANWSWATASVRAADANVTPGQGRVSFWVPREGAKVNANCFCGVSGSNAGFIGIGLNSTSAFNTWATTNMTSYFGSVSCSYSGNATVGPNYLQRLEAESGGSMSFYYTLAAISGGNGLTSDMFW
jgi:hypothetical protein